MDTRTMLITGASSGIGAAFARKLASQGHHLVLVARREARLRELAADLQQQFPINAEILVADLSTAAGVECVEKRIAKLETLDKLINNAGFGTLGKFSEVELDRQLDMIWVHVIASVRLTRVALPGMIARRQGAVINVSSIGAWMPGPGNVTYCATKAYLNAFTQALAAELEGTGVRVQALNPGFTFTEFHASPEYQRLPVRSRLPRYMWMSADEVVAASLLALERGQVLYIPGIQNRLLIALSRIGLASLGAKLLVKYFPELVATRLPAGSVVERQARWTPL